MKMQRTWTVAGLAVTTLAVAAVATSGASVATVPDTPAPGQTLARPGAVAAATGRCDGGKSLGLKSRYSANPFSFSGTSGADVEVPGTEILLRGPKKGTDTLLITFSAETLYSGSGWMGLEVHLDGTPVNPYANNGSHYAITSSGEYAGSSAQFCVKLRKGLHKIEVMASTTGGAGADSGWIDDYLVSVLRFA